MKARPAKLAEIQRWLQSVITHPGGVSQGVGSSEAQQHLDVPAAELESVIRPSRALASEARLEIYVDAYHERLMECLREEFTATRHAVGHDLFNALAFGYLQFQPSRSYTLAALGGTFPHYLATMRLHERDAPAEASATWADFVIELAAFERLQRDVFDAEGSEGRTLANVRLRLEKLPSVEWQNLRLVPAACLRLFASEHPVHAYWTSLKRGDEPSVPAPARTLLAINRRSYVVERHVLDRVQYVLLESFLAGNSLGASIAAAAAVPECDPQALPARLTGWFADWTRQGFFVEPA